MWTIFSYDYISQHQILEKTDTTGALFLGNQGAAQDSKNIQENNIEAIMNCAIEVNIKFDIQQKLKDYLKLPMDDIDTQEITQYFDKSFEFIEKNLNNKVNVLVHCQAGLSRSASIVIAYIMRKRLMGFYETLNFVKNYRIVRPNLGFCKQLGEFDKKLKEDQQQQELQQKEKDKK